MVEWQTRRIQNPVLKHGCRFKSCQGHQNTHYAGVAKLADALVLGTSGEIRGGSSPSTRTDYDGKCSSVVEHLTVTQAVAGSIPVTYPKN